MAVRKISIDKEKCDGCGLCVTACHEGAIELVDGKAELVRENVCDGLGDCLPACPQGAISFEEPSSQAPAARLPVNGVTDVPTCPMANPGYQWPIQIALVPQRSDFFRGTIVVGADCTAFTVDDFRRRFLSGCPVIIGCPKLDDRARFDKIASILSENPVDHVRVVRMEVPCCRALTNIVKAAAAATGRELTVTETVISRSGSVVSEDRV